MTPTERAVEFREQLGLGEAPIRDMQSLIAAGARVDVSVMDMPEGVDGMTRCDPHSGAFIVAVATSDNPERQRFSLAHELGHIVFDDFTDNIGTIHAAGPRETRAHDFARHLLAPLGGVRRLASSLSGSPAEQLTSAVVQQFGISPQPAAIQLYAVDAISEFDKLRVSQLTSQTLATRYGWSAERMTRIADAQRPQPPQQIVAAATQAYADGRLSLRVLARLRGTTEIVALENELAAASLSPSEPPVERPNIDIDDW